MLLQYYIFMVPTRHENAPISGSHEAHYRWVFRIVERVTMNMVIVPRIYLNLVYVYRNTYNDDPHLNHFIVAPNGPHDNQDFTPFA